MAIEPGRKSNCTGFIVNGARYPLPTGDGNEMPTEIQQAFSKKFFETDARLEEERQKELAYVPR